MWPRLRWEKYALCLEMEGFLFPYTIEAPYRDQRGARIGELELFLPFKRKGKDRGKASLGWFRG